MELIYEGKIVGVSFEPAKSGLQRAYADMRGQAPAAVRLEHDPNNVYDNQAIKVFFKCNSNEHFVGHIPKPYNAKMLEAGLAKMAVKFDRWNIAAGRPVAGANIEVAKSGA